MMLSSIPQEWGPKTEHEGIAVARTRTGPNVIEFTAPANMALVMFTPQPKREVGLNSDRRTTGLAPTGSLEIIPAASELFARWIQEKQNLLIAIDPLRLNRLAQAEFDQDSFELFPPKFGSIDRQALDLARFMRWEVENQELGWRESLDALTTVFSIHLLRNYSSISGAPQRYYSGGLSPIALRRIDDYIQCNLQSAVSLERLSTMVGLSPSHFARAFKQSTGTSPHQYIIEARLIRARDLIRNSDMTLSKIAHEAGFSSNSHMTATMRRSWDVTPTRLLREK